jgi:prefoldin subunit 5
MPGRARRLIVRHALRSLARARAAQEEGESSLQTHFELSDAVYAKASVPLKEEQSVFLWLGANVMLEYPLAEAIALLSSNLTNAEKALAEIVADLGFLKDQMTTSEVNIARVYNWDVRERRKKAEQPQEAEA